ncbi:unnamed protein product [Auanema sp. JU1783]|nr:unnamed protein product [Auanema sp. JU1783]
MWEGPSWLVAEREANKALQEASPPNKWPRVTTPPSRRQSLLSEIDDSGLGLSFCSPPIPQKTAVSSSPLRTPRTRTIVHMSSTPSPFRSFRLSSFSSPTLSDRVLKLSNSNNVLAGVKFCENSMDKSHGQLDIAGLASNSAARTLELPTTSKDLTATAPTPMQMEPPETPSKCLSLEESGLFEDSYPLISTSTPLKNLSFESNRVPLPGCDISLISDPSFPFSDGDPQSPTTPSSFKKVMIDVERKGSLRPCQILERDEGPPAKKPNMDTSEVFRSPKKPIKPYSRKWLRIVTGDTKAQRDVTLSAKSFLSGMVNS